MSSTVQSIACQIYIANDAYALPIQNHLGQMAALLPVPIARSLSMKKQIQPFVVEVKRRRRFRERKAARTEPGRPHREEMVAGNEANDPDGEADDAIEQDSDSRTDD